MGLKYQFAHNIDTVFELLTDPDFLVERSISIGELSADCEIEEDGEKTTIKMNREVERDDLPKFLAKLFNPVQTLKFTEEWQSNGNNKAGKYSIDVVGQPVTIMAKLKLSETDEGCEYSIEHSAKASIPLIGGKIEKFIIGQTADGVEQEINYLREKLG